MLSDVPLARFFYGVAAGSGVGLLLMTLDGFEGWMIVVALIALAMAIGFHQQHRRRRIGRRWRRSPSLFQR